MFKNILRITSILILIVLLPLNTYADSSLSMREEVNEAISLGFVPKELQNDYTDNITRDEFAKMAVMFLSFMYDTDVKNIMSSKTDKVFLDTNDSYVNTAFDFGIINGKGNGEFMPNDSIKRQEAGKIVMNTYSAYLGNDWRDSVEEYVYEDGSQIEDWAREEIGFLSQYNIMNGVGENYFAPLEYYTREQSIAVFLRLYKKIKADEEALGGATEITQMLKVENGRLTDGSSEIVLKGINLGGWLIMETWMSPIEDIGEKMSYTEIIDILGYRFGKNTTRELLNKYEENFITESDFQTIKSLGFNCVRIPFWYRNFMTEDGEWLNGEIDNNLGFHRLDWAIKMCEKYGLYAILDMHGCPGGQSMNHSTGMIGENRLYTSERNLKMMESLWIEIAERYKNSATVAAYDIMNEPQNNGGYTGPRSWQAESEEAVEYTTSVHKRMVEAIRSVDNNHIISIEGIWSMEVLPNPKNYGWENMMYQLHIYDTTKDMIDMRVAEMEKARTEWGVAVFVGEYNSGELEKYASRQYAKHKIGRSKWTYKVIGDNIDSWGLYVKNADKLDIRKASFEEIKRAFTDNARTENGFVFNKDEYRKIK